MKSFILMIIGSLLFFLSGCSDPGHNISPVSSQVDEAAMAKDPVPFKGKKSGFSDNGETSSCSTGWISKYFEGQGNSTQLGLLNMRADYCILITSAQGGLIDNVEAVLTTANGDRLYLTFSGTITFDTYPPTSATLEASGTVSGGTGRFENATGTFEGIGIQDLTQRPTPLSMTWTGFVL